MSLKSWAILFVMSMVISTAPADDKPNIPASAWEQHPEGVALAMILVTQTENGTQKGAIKVYVKNTSSGIKYLPDNINDWAVQIFYIDNKGKHVPLRDYSAEQRPRTFTMPAMPDSRLYQPGEIGIRTIDLSPSELAVVKKYPVICHFYFGDVQIGRFNPIESSPKMLIASP